MGFTRDTQPDVEGLGSYEEYITGLIYFRNELEALMELWPRSNDGRRLTVSSCPQQRKDHFLARLNALVTGYEYTVREYSATSDRPAEGMESQVEPRPAGLPTLPGDDRLERDLLVQIDQLFSDLLDLKIEVTGSGTRHKVAPVNRIQWLVTYLSDWR